MTEMQKILSDRKDKYGEFRYQADLSISLKHVMREGNSWNDTMPYMQEALDMIQHKIARILNGDPYYEDSWVDIIGYAQLALDGIREDVENRRTIEAFQKWVEGNPEAAATVGGVARTQDVGMTVTVGDVARTQDGSTTVVTSVLGGAQALNSEDVAKILRHNGVGGGGAGGATVTSVGGAGTVSEFLSR